MWRFIFLGLIIWLGIYIFKQASRNSEGTQANSQQTQESETENMVQCATCNVHTPRSEAFLVDSSFYCCKAHIPNK